jgi:hypothetical protein
MYYKHLFLSSVSKITDAKSALVAGKAKFLGGDRQAPIQ